MNDPQLQEVLMQKHEGGIEEDGDDLTLDQFLDIR